MNRTIEITIDSQGGATVLTKGFTGSSCRDASAFIEKSLGEPVSEQLTPEFHQKIDASEALTQGQ